MHYPTTSPLRLKAKSEDIQPGTSVELAVLAVRENAYRCFLLKSGGELTLRSSYRECIVPGEILNVTIQKEWWFSGHPDSIDPDPIVEASERDSGGDPMGARKILMDLLEMDLRYLDAHAHLGNFVFDRHPERAIRHFEVGARIGELSLGENFKGLLPWAGLQNRPYLRCLHGLGLCLWRLERIAEAVKVFERMLWLSPPDEQGARFAYSSARANEKWIDEPA